MFHPVSRALPNLGVWWGESWLCSSGNSNDFFPLFPQDAGGQQIGFLLGSCGIALALTTEVCLKGLPKTQNGEIVQFKGEISCVLASDWTSELSEGSGQKSWMHSWESKGAAFLTASLNYCGFMHMDRPRLIRAFDRIALSLWSSQWIHLYKAGLSSDPFSGIWQVQKQFY